MINLYQEQVGKLGKHVDNTEFVAAPIISLSIGASGVLNIPVAWGPHYSNRKP